MKCSNCGNKVVNSDLFCSECGKKIEKTKKYNLGQALGIGAVLAIAVQLIPSLVYVITSIGNVERSAVLTGVLQLFVFVIPVMVFVATTVILYQTKK